MRIPWFGRRGRKNDQNRTSSSVPEARLPGSREDWPWGQKPDAYMIDPYGYVAGPLGDPEGWIAAHRSNIEQRIRTELRRASGDDR